MTDHQAFDEAAYLEANPDIRVAVHKGDFASGWDHYQKYGKRERRVCQKQQGMGYLKKIKGNILQLGRDKKILANIDKKLIGLEIGPSHRPIAPKRRGFNVKILDHLSTDGLKTKYRDHGVDLDAIEEVDYIWSGEPISELVGEQRFDWIIASHVIEHTPDLIGFLNECEKILTDRGVLSLAVPDKRYCFDFFREPTSLANIIDAHVMKKTIHSPGTAADYFLNVTKKGDKIAWRDGHQGDYAFVHGIHDALTGMEAAQKGEYIDLHAWCFVPSSFRLLIKDLFDLNLTQLRELDFYDTVGHEFFITLRKNAVGSELTRMSLLKRKYNEMAGENLIQLHIHKK